jgi:hypothetical protein
MRDQLKELADREGETVSTVVRRGGYSKEQKARLAQNAEQIFASEQRVRMAIAEARNAMMAKARRAAARQGGRRAGNRTAEEA